MVDAADRIDATPSVRPRPLPVDLKNILQSGIQANVGMAFTVERERRILELLERHKLLDFDGDALDAIDELIMLHEWVVRDVPNAFGEGPGVDRARYDQLFEHFHSSVGASALLYVLESPRPAAAA